MHLKKEKAFNRLTGLFDEGLGRMHTMTDTLEERLRDDATKMAKQAKEGLRRGRDQFMSAEELLVRKARAHPFVFILAGLGVLGLIAAKILWDSRSDHSEW